MDEVLPVLAVVGFIAASLGVVAWVGRRARERGIGVTPLDPVDEIFHPSAHRFRIEIQMQAERMVPMPASPDDQSSPRRLSR